MVRIDIAFEGSLRCRATHGPSGSVLETDAPVDNCGRGERFSPTDLVATALGACLATLMGIVAERDGIALRGLGVTVEKEMVADPDRRIGRLGATVQMPGGLAPAQRRKLEAAARACPVAKSLGERVRVEMAFLYPD